MVCKSKSCQKKLTKNTKLRGGLSEDEMLLLNELLAYKHPTQALHLASTSRAHRGDDQTWWALSKYKDPNNLRTYLMYACKEGNLERAKFLIEHGAEVNASDKKGYTSLMYASLDGNLNVARLLLDNKVPAKVNAVKTDTGSTSLMLACNMNHLDIARLLLDRGANVDAARTYDGATSLFIASLYGYLEIARLLLDRGANVDAELKDSETPLMLASRKGHLDVARLLLDRGANVNAARTNNGMTSLMLASENGDLELARLLLDRGANVNAVDIYGNNSLKKAKNNKIKQLLKEYGATK